MVEATDGNGATWLSQAGAARLLPISAATLRAFARWDPFFGPDLAALSGVPAGARAPRVVRYHVAHVRLIEAVLCGELDRETAGLKLELWRRRRSLATEGTEITEEAAE